jgi:hypothetical protein
MICPKLANMMISDEDVTSWSLFAVYHYTVMPQASGVKYTSFHAILSHSAFAASAPSRDSGGIGLAIHAQIRTVIDEIHWLARYQ